MTDWTQLARQTWQKAWLWLSVGRLALILLAIAACSVLLAATTNVLEAWLPNIATTATAVAITITVVEQLFLREKREREAGRRQAAYVRLSMAFLSLTQRLATDYALTHRHGDIEFDFKPVEVMRHWLEDKEDSRRLPARGGNPPLAATTALDFAETVQRVLDEDRDVLPDDLRAALTEVVERRAQDEGVERRAQDLARSDDILPEQAEDIYLWIARRIIEAALTAALVLHDAPAVEWHFDWQGTVRLEAVPQDELSI